MHGERLKKIQSKKNLLQKNRIRKKMVESKEERSGVGGERERETRKILLIKETRTVDESDQFLKDEKRGNVEHGRIL